MPYPVEASIAALDPADPFLREAQTFPVLSEEQVARIARYGAEEPVAAGALLFQRGQRAVDFFVVLAGQIEMLDPARHGEIIYTYGPRQFTGEMNLFNSREILVSARAVVDGRVLRLRSGDFRRLIAADSEIAEIVMRAFILRRVGLIRHAMGGVTLLGPAHAADMLRLRTFLTRNTYPFRLADTEVEPGAAEELLGRKIAPDEPPLVVPPVGPALRNPSNLELAEALGLTETIPDDEVFDVIVVGGGPAGLATAVYAASEGLSTLVVEAMASGGQAGTSSKIENYLGFPTGISGQALAGRAQAQAQKFGARLAIARPAETLDCSQAPFCVQFEGGDAVRGRTVVVATGARYRRLAIPGFERFEGQGIHYAATAMEAQLCAGEEVTIVGGGNSAGQAAIYLSGVVRHVRLIIRGQDLAATMSEYLIERIRSSPKITVHPQTEVTALFGDHWLSEIGWADRRTGDAGRWPVSNLFLMIGAEPNTGWLQGCVRLDDKGFVETGRNDEGQALGSQFATTRPGIFAVGDVRAGSIKRVASAVGEGSVVVQAIHQYLAPGLA